MSVTSHVFRSSSLFILLIVSSIIVNAQRPNIIYIMTDDMGYGDLSCYGRKEYSTPNLDKLASQGIKFVNAYAAAPLCTPTRTAFMTGRYPARTPVGLMEPLTGSKRDSAYGLSTKFPSLPTIMKQAGYETGLVGKWHLGFTPEHSPRKNGFDYFFGIHSGAADYISHIGGDRRRLDLYENETPVDTEGYMTDLIADKAIAFLKVKRKKPIFMAITFTAPHWPWQARGDKPYHDTLNFRAGGSPEIFAAMMTSLDEAIGKIIKTVDDELGETIVIFTNDNGGEKFSNNGGLSKGKNTLWEGGIRVPAFVRWPGKIQPGKQTEQVAVTMDWTATILAAAGAKAHPEFPLDGIDLMPVMTGKQQPFDRTILWRSSQRVKHKAVRSGTWKYLEDENGEYLFNLANDNGEKNNLKEKEQLKFLKLKGLMNDWEKTVLPPIPLN